VSRGTGFWGPPMRLFHPAEITEITVRATAAT
jgi:predicted MPP superfamily phosphohydrolase